MASALDFQSKDDSSILFTCSMNESAVILNGQDVVKVTNLKRKYNKLAVNPKITILEECTKEQLENRYNYWKDFYKVEEDDELLNPVYHHIYKNQKTGWTIYSTLEEIIEHEGYELIK